MTVKFRALHPEWIEMRYSDTLKLVFLEEQMRDLVSLLDLMQLCA